MRVSIENKNLKLILWLIMIFKNLDGVFKIGIRNVVKSGNLFQGYIEQKQKN